MVDKYGIHFQTRPKKSLGLIACINHFLEKINEKIFKIWKIEEFQKNDPDYLSTRYRHYFHWGPAPIL
jgi:hypothetical protein